MRVDGDVRVEGVQEHLDVDRLLARELEVVAVRREEPAGRCQRASVGETARRNRDGPVRVEACSERPGEVCVGESGRSALRGPHD